MSEPRQNNPLVDVVITIVLPSLILMNLSGAERLGSVGALLLALSLPLGWGIYDLVRQRKVNFFAVLGLVSVLLTGGIGLLKLDAGWLAIKEAAIPAILGLVVLGSTYTRWPLIRTLLYNPKVVNVPRIEAELAKRSNTLEFERSLGRATYALAGTFFFSATMNWLLATWVVTSPAGTEAFNEELGRMTLLSYPVIAIPSMVMMIGVFFYLIKRARTLTGLTLEDLVHQKPEQA